MARRCSCISSTPIRCHDVRMHSGPDWPCDDNKPCAWRLTHSARGIPAQFRKKKNRCPISGRPTDLLFSRRFFSPEAQSVTDPPNRFSELPFPFSRAHPPAQHHRGRLGKTAKPQSHISHAPIPNHQTPPVSITPTHTTSRRPTGRPVVTALSRQGFACRRPLPPATCRVGLASPTKPWPNRGPAAGSSLNLVSISAYALARATSHFFPRWNWQRGRCGARTKEKKRCRRELSRARALVDSLFCCCFSVSSSYTPPHLFVFCCCIIVPTLSFSGFDGAAQRDRLVAVASSGGMG